MAPGSPLLFLYEVSIVVLIDSIEILLTQGIFLIQIVKTNNTSMYLIHFNSKNIYEFREVRRDVHGPPYIFCLLFKKMKKIRKKYKNMTYT